jgi:Alg9-like mannosyltransferase family
MKDFINKLDLKKILLIGLVFRLLAVFFSAGYGFNDDHFEIIELARKWRDGVPFNWVGGDVYIFSLVYPGIHYVLIGLCDILGISDPQMQMLIIRIFHALVSMLGIYYGYLLAFRLSDRQDTAKIIALIIAVFWVFPFMSVRNLREFFCIPFLLMGCYYASEKAPTHKSLFLAALFFATSISMRIQTLFIPFGIGVYWLFNKKTIKIAIIYGIFFGIAFMLTQGLFDLLYYGNPLAATLAYLNYNANPTNIAGYPQGPWHQYIGTVAGLVLGFPFIPLVIGYFRTVRMNNRLQMLFWASLLMFVFHSYYANKQERFILPFMPIFITLGVIGFQDFYEQYQLVPKKSLWVKIIFKFIIVLNLIAVCLLSVTYSKRSRVEAMSYLYKKGDVSNIILEGAGSPPPPPLYYLGKHLNIFEIDAKRPIEDLAKEIAEGKKTTPNYIIMVGDENFETRLKRLQTLYPKLQHETDLTPSFVDNIAYRLNPSHNQNEVWRVYQIKQ